MTYIKLEQAHTDDERWIVAGADAFALHVSALVYCDRQLLDGCITRAMALRVSLAVPPDRSAAAVDALVAHGFWQEVATGYLINGYEEHAFPAEQIKRTRERWSQDKRRRQQHSIGDHSLCKDPKFCPAIRWDSTVESTVESTSGGSHLYQTRPDQTGGMGMGAAAGSAGAPPAPLEAHLYDWDNSDDGDCGRCHLPPEHPVHRAGFVMFAEVYAWPEAHTAFDRPDGAPCCPFDDDHPIHTTAQVVSA
jgi:hypothetical protein